MNKKTLLKRVGVFLLTVVMVLSASAVIANTNKITIINSADKSGHRASASQFVWDNDLTYEVLLACQMDPTYGELGSDADDFQLTATQTIGTIYWIGGYWNGNPGSTSWQITFYADDGSGTTPGAVLWGPTTFPYADCNEEFVEQVGTSYYYRYWVVLSHSFIAQAGVKYWIGWQGQLTYPPQSGIAGHSLVTLHEEKFKSAYFGYPTWTDASAIFGETYDIAFALGGGPPPPVADFTWAPSNPTTQTIIQFTDLSYNPEAYIVNWTWDFGDGHCSFDQNPTHQYNNPGTYTVCLTVINNYGSNDSVSKNIIVNNPAKVLDLNITGGIGISIKTKNVGYYNATNVTTHIIITGGILNHINITRNGPFVSPLPPGDTLKEKVYPIGLGPITVDVTVSADNAVPVTKTAEGIIVLFFVILM